MFFSRVCGGACDAWGVVTNPINILPLNLFPRPEYHDTMHALSKINPDCAVLLAGTGTGLHT